MLENGIIFGRNAVFELFDSDISVNSLYIAENSPIKGRALALAKKKGCSLKEVKPEKLSLLSGGKNHQGIVAAVSAVEYKGVGDILAVASERGEKPFLILLDSVEDPHNLVAVIRTAECAGAHGVIIEKRHSAQVSDTVVKTSAGAALHLPVCRVANAAAAVRELKSKGLWIVGADMDGEDYRRIDYDMPLCLIIGSEGNGIKRIIREECDFIASIPQFGKINSLNASVAAALLIYEAVRGRNN